MAWSSNRIIRFIGVSVGVLCLAGILIVGWTLLFPQTRHDINPKQFSAAVQQQILEIQGQILLQQYLLQTDRLHRARTITKAFPIAAIIFCLFVGAMIFRKTRPYITISTETETMNVPIRHDTETERHLYAIAPVVRNLALAQGDQFDRMVTLWETTVHDLKSGPAILHSMTSGRGSGVETNCLPAHVPTFRTLLEQQMLAYGQPLIMGYHNGEPEYRTLASLKSIGIAGLQGSGKTLSTAYLIGSALLTCRAEGYLLDPHSGHPESLTARVRPLIAQGYIKTINPFYVKNALQELNQRIDRRLSGQESCSPPIVVAFDELSRVAKSAQELLSMIITFIERCTEETRKAQVAFFGISPKWTARHFGGRADIRGCLNSVLVHQMKASQAKLLLEDPEEKQLLKQIKRPGEGILVTDYSEPVKITIPFCANTDFVYLAECLSTQHHLNETIETVATTLPSVELLDNAEITTTIKQMIGNTDLRLQDIYTHVFPNEDIRFETFRTKYQSPQKRPWKDRERRQLSMALPQIQAQYGQQGT